MAGSDWVLLDEAGRIIEVGPRFADLLRTTPEALIGRDASDLTAPADRARCNAILQTLMSDHRPVATVKRLVRADGSHVWVNTALAYVADAGSGPGCVCTCEPANLPDDWVEPNKLLRIAKFLEHSRRARCAAFNRQLFNDPAWDMILLAYIREAQGDVIDARRLCEAIGIALASGIRWMRALIAEQLIECEDGRRDPVPDCAFHLTAEAHRRVERYLADLYNTLTPADRMNMPA